MYEQYADGDDSAVIISTENTARIAGPINETIAVTHTDTDCFLVKQDEGEVWMERSEAEALFLVLDTMLHGGDER